MAFIDSDIGYSEHIERRLMEAQRLRDYNASNRGLGSIMDSFIINRSVENNAIYFRSGALGIEGEIVNGKPVTTGILEPEKPSKPKPKTIRQKLQAEVNSWLNDIK